MSVLAHIGRAVEKQLITAIVAAGRGKPLIERFSETRGVLTISHHHARGVGARRVRTGQMYFQERDVLMLMVESEFADAIFEAIYEAAGIGAPGGGIIFSEPVIRGHPMMPFDGADW